MEEINIQHWAKNWLLEKGLEAETANYLTFAIDIALIVIISLLVDWIARRVILSVVSRYVKRSKNNYDDVFLEKRVFQSLGHLLPALIVYYTLPYIFGNTDFSYNIIQKIVVVYILILLVRVSHKFLKALEHIALHNKRFEGKPISSYVQVGLIVLYIMAGVFIISTLVGKDALTVLGTFGAATAIILLIFKDTILGLVASIQISGNDMVRLGDWVSMEKYGADGDVIEINLTTVKVRNWDKTISTVPTYAFISDSFKNWRGMQNQGVRRIKRSIIIDMNTIKFVDDEMRNRFCRYSRVRSYIEKRQTEIDLYNKDHNVDKSELINGRHMTNIGIFRNYALNYLLEHPKIDNEQTVMVRQLQPTETGLPFEIYCFSNDIAWVNYEGIQSDIMDHLLSAVEKFELRIFQNPAGYDFRQLAKS